MVYISIGSVKDLMAIEWAIVAGSVTIARHVGSVCEVGGGLSRGMEDAQWKMRLSADLGLLYSVRSL
jgi:hypothetical protein